MHFFLNTFKTMFHHSVFNIILFFYFFVHKNDNKKLIFFYKIFYAKLL